MRESDSEEEPKGVSLVGAFNQTFIPSFIGFVCSLDKKERKEVSGLLAAVIPEDSVLSLFVKISDTCGEDVLEEMEKFESFGEWIKATKTPTGVIFKETEIANKLAKAEAKLSAGSREILFQLLITLVTLANVASC